MNLTTNQQFTIKVSHLDDTKEIKFPISLKFSDLDRISKEVAWSMNLPQRFNYYHLEDDEAITVDDQESFDEAVSHTIKDL